MTQEDSTRTIEPRRVSGTRVVVMMFAFGIVATGLLWMYWTFHTAPFRPFREALADKYPESAPRVDGGRRKMHKETPAVVRVVMRVGFDPIDETAKAEAFLDEVIAFSKSYIDLGQYDQFEAHFYKGIPEKEVRQQEYIRSLSNQTSSE